MFKLCFTVQDPYQQVPDRKTNPFHKVNSFLKWMKQICVYAWRAGLHLAGDEQTLSFQGMHQDKLRITFKQADDGCQCDAIYDQGYTITFYFRNTPLPLKYTREG